MCLQPYTCDASTYKGIATLEHFITNATLSAILLHYGGGAFQCLIYNRWPWKARAETWSNNATMIQINPPKLLDYFRCVVWRNRLWSLDRKVMAKSSNKYGRISLLFAILLGVCVSAIPTWNDTEKISTATIFVIDVLAAIDMWCINIQRDCYSRALHHNIKRCDI